MRRGQSAPNASQSTKQIEFVGEGACEMVDLRRGVGLPVVEFLNSPRGKAVVAKALSFAVERVVHTDKQRRYNRPTLNRTTSRTLTSLHHRIMRTTLMFGSEDSGHTESEPLHRFLPLASRRHAGALYSAFGT